MYVGLFVTVQTRKYDKYLVNKQNLQKQTLVNWLYYIKDTTTFIKHSYWYMTINPSIYFLWYKS